MATGTARRSARATISHTRKTPTFTSQVRSQGRFSTETADRTCVAQGAASARRNLARPPCRIPHGPHLAGALLGSCAALTRSAASRPGWDLMPGRIRPPTLETPLALRHSRRSLDAFSRRRKHHKRRANAGPACDRRVEDDQVDSDAPLTARCPVPMPPLGEFCFRCAR